MPMDVGDSMMQSFRNPTAQQVEYMRQMGGIANQYREDQNKWLQDSLGKIQQQTPSYQPVNFTPQQYTPQQYTPTEMKMPEYKPVEWKPPDMSQWEGKLAKYYDTAANQAAQYYNNQAASAAARQGSAMAATARNRGLARSSGPQTAWGNTWAQQAGARNQDALSNIFAQSGNQKAGAMAGLAQALMNAELDASKYNAASQNDWNKTLLGYDQNWNQMNAQNQNAWNLANLQGTNQYNLANAGYANQLNQMMLDNQQKMQMMNQQALLNAMTKGGNGEQLFADMLAAASRTYGQGGGGGSNAGAVAAGNPMSGYGGDSMKSQGAYNPFEVRGSVSADNPTVQAQRMAALGMRDPLLAQKIGMS